ncbi:hypothetical protein JWG39_12015 [Desulforhopalus vacuolatus]|nr:hypothetical protein [Desulforhopalus vacuolatus]MBM9520541.1 hypothetical protein [Desulforhopalus vacuolatus]
MKNRHGDGFPQCCSVDKACLVSTLSYRWNHCCGDFSPMMCKVTVITPW